MKPTATVSILEGARLLARHGGVVEARILKTARGTVSGYFDNLDALAGPRLLAGRTPALGRVSRAGAVGGW
jgi:hypothetical protein